MVGRARGSGGIFLLVVCLTRLAKPLLRSAQVLLWEHVASSNFVLDVEVSLCVERGISGYREQFFGTCVSCMIWLIVGNCRPVDLGVVEEVLRCFFVY